jgi:hypothetical protein
MKKILVFAILIGILNSQKSFAQDDKSKLPSPPATVSTTLSSGATITINYSQPAVKGRTIGKNLEPMEGKVWRTGANDATVFENSKGITVEGKTLAAGKYGFFTIVKNGEWTIIFNKTWKQWGAFEYKEAEDVLRVNVKGSKSASFSERMTFLIDKSGKVSLLWGDHQVNFQTK